MLALRPKRFGIVGLLALALVSMCASCSRDPLEKVRDLQAQGLFKESLEPARAVIEARPDDPEAAYRYGLALARTGWLSLSHFALRKAMESPDWLVPAGLEIAGAQLATDNLEEAIAVASQVLEAEPDHLEALALRTQARVRVRTQYEEAIRDAEHLVELDPGNLEGMMLRVVSLLGLKRVAEAEAGLAEIELSAQSADEESLAGGLCAMKSVLAVEKGEPETAERLFEECLEAHPTDVDVVQHAVEFFEAQHRPERAEAVLRTVLEEEPAGVAVRRALADRLRRRGAAAEAEQLLREGTELPSPDRALAAWVDLANHFHAQENHAEAAAALERAVKLAGASADPQLLFDYADALVIAGRYDDALALARDLEIPTHRELVEGRVALEQGRAADALGRFSAALLLWPDNAVARYYAALSAEASLDFDRAIEEYRYSIRINPLQTDARARLALLYEAEGASSQALTALQHDAGRNPPGPEAELIALRVLGRLGRMPQVRAGLAKFSSQPGMRGPAVAAAARGIREGRGPAEAASFILEVGALDLTDPANEEALRELVTSLSGDGQGSEAVKPARLALDRHPESSRFHAIHGAALVASGAPTDAVRAAYSRALELDPSSAEALAGLARVASQAGDAAGASDLYARAAAADPDSADPLRELAELLVAQGRRAEAEDRLVAALRRNPRDGASSALLAELLLERDAEPDRALALAKAAVRFGGTPERYALLARAHSSRGEADLASAALARSQAGPKEAAAER